ncbi:MAG: HAD family hydrolase, partial [Mycobacterium leprae]
RSQCVAVGDWLNDLDLLAAAGTSVAMANAHPDVKAVADHTTAGNMADGVAVVLEAIVAGQRLK